MSNFDKRLTAGMAVVLLGLVVAAWEVAPTTHPHLRKTTYTPGMVIHKEIWISPKIYLEYEANPRLYGGDLQYDQHLWVWMKGDLSVSRSSVQEMLDELDQVSGAEK